MTEIIIRTAADAPLDCKVEVGEGQVVVHSRSGAGATARNPDYRPALEAILERLAANGLTPDVYLDSKPAQKKPLSERLIVKGAALTGSGPEQFNFLVRAMNAGTDSHGAWRRILLDVPGRSRSELVSTLNGTGSSTAPIASSDRNSSQARRLTAAEQRMASASHIASAVDELLAGHEMPHFANSRDYDLVTPGGDRLASKKVFGRALELAGVVAQAVPKNFSAGWGQPSFELLEAAGFSVMPKVKAAAEAARRKGISAEARSDAKELADQVGADSEERAWVEGDKRMVNHLRIERKRSTKAAAAKRAAVRSANDGRLACDHCQTDWYQVYPHQVAEAIFDVHHTIPLAEMKDGHETKVEDLLCLCANCHRAEHRKMALGL